jgi:hypothetical protein
MFVVGPVMKETKNYLLYDNKRETQHKIGDFLQCSLSRRVHHNFACESYRESTLLLRPSNYNTMLWYIQRYLIMYLNLCTFYK